MATRSLSSSVVSLIMSSSHISMGQACFIGVSSTFLCKPNKNILASAFSAASIDKRVPVYLTALLLSSYKLTMKMGTFSLLGSTLCFAANSQNLLRIDRRCSQVDCVLMTLAMQFDYEAHAAITGSWVASFITITSFTGVFVGRKTGDAVSLAGSLPFVSSVSSSTIRSLPGKFSVAFLHSLLPTCGSLAP
ncbi:T. brucei spp.-specific protein [Trypanosoma brucei gambiense DAL972]|uniref:T. brucei spp.-specific protein n=1 Tax=Trypanosoma brucei gambiense (strain MHOM/CI/86/DAL972) TaxID=679716 RepID=C9ZJK7_TRYB9|nr:T. brucei spp.-specific protein [Trypanosoma brucei gambiense DAL972]CBH09566.1 T. brucei spp.-specific protein [Trypanosoma brucei gambiense DAL972]|eukprot:XP_011771871.1 T. brucei spp.-specific protein [Trypanosoma brucei gambiense DAL972]